MGDRNGHVRKHGACLFIRNQLRFEVIVLGYPNVAAVVIVDFIIYNIHIYIYIYK